MEAGQRGTVDGLAAAPDPAAPWLPTGNAMSNAMSAGTNEASGHPWTSDDPIAAFCRGSDGLAPGRAGSRLGRCLPASPLSSANPLALAPP